LSRNPGPEEDSSTMKWNEIVQKNQGSKLAAGLRDTHGKASKTAPRLFLIRGVESGAAVQ